MSGGAPTAEASSSGNASPDGSSTEDFAPSAPVGIRGLTTILGGGGSSVSSSVASRRAVWNQHPAVRREWEVPATPLDLVAQLRGDFESYSQEVYGLPIEEPATTVEDFRARRRRERLQLDSLHARLHGLRLILAMARECNQPSPEKSTALADQLPLTHTPLFAMAVPRRTASGRRHRHGARRALPRARWRRRPFGHSGALWVLGRCRGGGGGGAHV